MSCEGYRGKLIDALASGERSLAGDAAAHLRTCAECMSFYEAQVHLFRAIDSGVRAMVNEVMPASLLPRVRARVGEIGVPRRVGSGYWVPICAALAFVILLGIFLVRPKYVPVRVAVVPTIDSPAPKVVASPSGRETSSTVNGECHALPEQAPLVRHLEVARSIATGETLQVVVGHEESLGLEMLARNISRYPELGQALVQPSTMTEALPNDSQPIKIEDLDVQPLQAQK